MELLDRYLQAVRKHLPGDRQDDIIAELRANLESQVEEKEEELGRALMPEEARAWLKELGSPLLMAAKYSPQRSLIGPALFPIFWYVLKLSLGAGTVIYAIVNVVQLAVTQPVSEDVAGWLFRLPGLWVTIAAWVTGVFATLEFVAARFPDKCGAVGMPTANWDPASLPPVVKRAPGGGKPVSLAATWAGLIFTAFWLGWMLVLPRNPFLLMGPAVFYFRAHGVGAGPATWTFYWWVLGLNGLQLVLRGVDLARGTWRVRRRLRQVLDKVLGLMPLLAVLAGPHVFLVQKPGSGLADMGESLAHTNQSITVGFAVLAGIMCLQIAWEMGRMGMEARRKREAGRSGLAG